MLHGDIVPSVDLSNRVGLPSLYLLVAMPLLPHLEWDESHQARQTMKATRVLDMDDCCKF